MSHIKAWIESVAASASGRCILKSFCTSFAIVTVGVGVLLMVLNVIVYFRHLTWLDRDPREDPWFLYVGFLAPTVLTLLPLVSFQGPLCRSLIRRHRYSVCV